LGPKKRLSLAALAILLVGLASGALIYAFSDEAVPDAIGYVIVNGEAYPIAPLTDKRYVRTLEQAGGKAAVIFDELGRWLASLWRGKTLGLTIGALGTAAAVALFGFARWLPPDEQGD
jgi:hypothetical protein